MIKVDNESVVTARIRSCYLWKPSGIISHYTTHTVSKTYRASEGGATMAASGANYLASRTWIGSSGKGLRRQPRIEHGVSGMRELCFTA